MIELVMFQSVDFSQYHQLHTGTCDGYIHPSQVIQEAYLPVFIGTHKTDENNIAFLSLEAVYGINGEQAAVRTQGGTCFYFIPEILHLCLIRRNDSEVYPFVENAVSADTLDIGFQFFQ